MKRLRILLYGINYSPELIGIGKYTGEMAEWLAANGHEVRVVTAPPYYPMWRVMEGYSAVRYKKENKGGIRVYRCPLWIPSRLSGLTRLVHLMSFAATSLPVVLFHGLFWRPDLVWTVEPAFFCAPGALAAALAGGSSSWLHVQDFELDAAASLGMVNSGAAARAAGAVERFIMRRFSRVSTISAGMMKKLGEKGVAPSRAVLFPNWVDSDVIYPMESQSPLRSELGIGADKLVLLYSGNMGEKQGLDILIDAAEIVAGDKRLVFVLCGQGGARERLEKRASVLGNVKFIPLQPFERLNSLLNLADIHLLPQRADVADLVMPSKLLGILASGRPVVATAHEGTQIAREVKGRGIVVPPGDAAALSEAVRELADNAEERRSLGRAARDHCRNSWDVSSVLKRFETEAAGLKKGLNSHGTARKKISG